MLRFIIDTSNGDLYIWDGQHALHRDLFKILKLKDSYIGGNFNSYSKHVGFDPNSYTKQFKDNPQLIINHTIQGLQKYIKDISDYKFYVGFDSFKVDNHGEILDN